MTTIVGKFCIDPRISPQNIDKQTDLKQGSRRKKVELPVWLIT